MGKIGVIIQREFNERVRKRSFILTTIVMPLLFVGVMLAPMLIMNARTSGTKTIYVADGSGLVADKLQDNRQMRFITTNEPGEELKVRLQTDGLDGAYGVLVVGADVAENPRNVQLFTRESSTLEIETAISRQIQSAVETEKLKSYNIDNLNEILAEVRTPVALTAYRTDAEATEKESSSGMALVMAFVFGLLIYMFILMYGAMVMTGVIEEKNSKVLEIMVSSVKPFQLMMGKIVGIASVALTQLLIWIVLIVVFMMVAMHFISPEMAAQAGEMAGSMGGMPAGLDPAMLKVIDTLTDPAFILRMLGGFVVFFIGGYLLYSAMFAAVGSAVDNAADSQQLQLPITIPLILAIFVMMNVVNDPHSQLAVWFSMIPFTSPIIMMTRLPYGVPAWEFALSVVLLYATFVLFVWLAGKIYRVGIFMYGKKPSLKEVLKWSRYKY